MGVASAEQACLWRLNLSDSTCFDGKAVDVFLVTQLPPSMRLWYLLVGHSTYGRVAMGCMMPSSRSFACGHIGFVFSGY
jgi:hypothetical protein